MYHHHILDAARGDHADPAAGLVAHAGGFKSLSADLDQAVRSR